MQTYTLVQGDSAPQIKATITRFDTGAAVDFSGGSARMRFRKKGATALIATLNAADIGTNFADGIAVFSFSDTDLVNLSAGYYEGEIEITYSTGLKETIFEVQNYQLRGDF